MLLTETQKNSVKAFQDLKTCSDQNGYVTYKAISQWAEWEDAWFLLGVPLNFTYSIDVAIEMTKQQAKDGLITWEGIRRNVRLFIRDSYGEECAKLFFDGLDD